MILHLIAIKSQPLAGLVITSTSLPLGTPPSESLSRLSEIEKDRKERTYCLRNIDMNLAVP